MKSKTHIYMANLLIDELKQGGVTFPEGVGYFVPPEEIKAAILACPNEFRAGSAGPDFYPDIEIGQTMIHPKNSGQWLVLMFDEFGKLAVHNPERQQALSFLLGFMMHYSADLYGHEYVNRWAKGWFPDMKEAISDTEKMQKIVRHILVETYMDNKVPKNQNTQLRYPRKFVRQCFLSSNALSKYEKKPKLVFADELEKFAKKVSDNSIVNALCLDYFKSWEQQLDQGMDAWLDIWHNITQDMVSNDRTMGDAKNEIINWYDNYFKYMTPAPKFLVEVEKYLSKLNIIKPVTDAIKKELIVLLVNQFAKAFVKAATGREVEDAIGVCEDILKQPELYLNNGILFEERNITERLDQDFGNFGQCSDTLDQTFYAFAQCLNMGKLCLIGTENLNSIVQKEKGMKQELFKNFICKGSIEELTIEIKTKENGWFTGYGTDDDIYFDLHVEGSEKFSILLDIPGFYNDFESNMTTVYKFRLPRRVGYDEIQGFTIRKVPILDDDWTPEWIKISVLDNRIIWAQEIHKTFSGNDAYSAKLDLESVAENRDLHIDHRIISFLYSLDGVGKTDQNNPTQYKQWMDEGNIFYSDLQLREQLYLKLFGDGNHYAYIPK